MNDLGQQIQRTKSNIEEAIQRTGRNFSNTFKQAKQRLTTNTRNYVSNINRSMARTNSNSNSNSMVAVNTSKNGSSWMYFILGILIILMAVVLVMMIYYLLTDCQEKKSLYDYIWDPTTPCLKSLPQQRQRQRQRQRSEIDIEIPGIRQVFHISNQDYTYDQAKCKCAAYGARLATQAELAEAYNRGADWCTYGWSAGQQAFYPTQPESWKKNYDCGKPGLNGGFFANPNLKFGVNCYGIKPEGKVVKPKTPRKVPFCQRKPNFQASHVLETDVISPFNKNRWNQ